MGFLHSGQKGIRKYLEGDGFRDSGLVRGMTDGERSVERNVSGPRTYALEK